MKHGPMRMLSAALLAISCGSTERDENGGVDEGGWLTQGAEGTTDDGPGNDDGASAGGDKLDVGGASDVPVGGCAGDHGGQGPMGESEIEFSYIWVANSDQGTISKIDTQTLQEMGRYLVRPDGAGSPSRTSVNSSGDVAVASRSGGITKVIANPENCPDLNGDGVITTSAGGQDIKAWGEDECVVWHTPFNYTSQRPVAWAHGEWNPTTCQHDNQKLWTAGLGAQGNEVLLLDGETGAVEQTIPIPGFQGDTGFGIYGAAVDGDGNFWGAPLRDGTLVFVDRETFEHRTWVVPTPSYGMTVDSDGYVWTCAASASRFDPMTETWQSVQTGGLGGCMADGAGTLWVAAGNVSGGVFGDLSFTNQRLVAVDTQTVQVLDEIPLPKYAHGVSIDFQGYVWGVTYMEPEAYRVDPVTKQIDTFVGLTGPYTYSDMTGFALQNAGTNPPPPA
jgi:streptogramin lyase